MGKHTNTEPTLVIIPIGSAICNLFFKGWLIVAYMRLSSAILCLSGDNFCLTLLWFSVVTVLCEFLSNVNEKSSAEAMADFLVGKF
ncbi:uncharacterized protein METZ01_LOCUS471987 [marine metagenome]|uniref:Uncharacterized protein n=1 Tax=marine metagenome TaxID=408172 RepID=A0A383BH44_9ZZZZ